MFARIIAAVCTAADDVLITFVTVEVAGVEYVVTVDQRHGYTRQSISIESGVNKTEQTTASTIWVARLILQRELRRRGVTRCPKVWAVKALHHLIADAVKDARNAYEYEEAIRDAYNDSIPLDDDDGIAAYYDEVSVIHHAA